MFQDERNDITRQDFAEGYTLFAFDITPDCCDCPHFNFIYKGNLRVKMHSDEPLKQTVNVIVYGKFESVFETDRNTNVVTETRTQYGHGADRTPPCGRLVHQKRRRRCPTKRLSACFSLMTSVENI